MLWFLIVVLAVVVVLALLALLVLAASFQESTESQQARIEMEVRRAERQLHDVARASFAAMLNEARER